jgi:hydrogenase/urease accessory protein HupE
MRTHHALAVFLLIGVLGAYNTAAHELRPAYLELRQTTPDTFDVLWKVPAAGEDLRLALYVRLPDSCVNLSEPLGIFSSGAHLARWRVKAPHGLSGERITIDGLASTMTDVLVRLERLDGTTQVTRLTPAHPSFLVEASPDNWQVVRTYLVLGVEHILTGIDHLLFVLALILITRSGWKVVKTVTAFTLAHSITLTAATLGFVHVPQRPVEAVIALSIVFVAAEILHSRQGRMGITARAPWVVALTFGLLHGLGFAGGLSEAGLPQGHIPLALLCFSLGVETGHFFFVGLVLSLRALARHLKLPVLPWAHLVPPYAIGSVAMCWVIQRVVAF